MNVKLEDLLRLNKSHIKPAINRLTGTFQNYPLLNYYYHDELTKKRIAHYFLSLEVFSGIRYGEVYVTSHNLEGLAVWIPSDKYPMTLWRLLRSVPLSVLFGLGRYGGNNVCKIIKGDWQSKGRGFESPQLHQES
jgi:hypothetical protein